MFCPHCGKEVSENQVFCQFCGGKIAVGPIPSQPGRVKTAWEEEGTQWTVSGLTATLRESLFHPSDFFLKMNVTGGLAGPMLYAMVVGMTGIMMFYVWQVLFHDAYPEFMMAKMRDGHGSVLFSGIGMAGAAVLTPFLIIMVLFVWSGLLHVLLLLVRGAKNGFEATFRAVSYSYGSNIFMAIPFCGWMIAVLWNIIVLIIALKETHGTSGGKATFAVLFPLILCCVIVVLFSILVLGTVAASFGTMTHEPWK